ncbi:ORF6N domain-containing protein [Aeromonas caviae]
MNTNISAESLSLITHNQIPVLTTETLAQLYDTEVIRIQQNHQRNNDRFTEGKHYFKLVGQELKSLRLSLSELQISPKARSLILWTERGAARHAKMLETEQAWEVFEKLEDCYFKAKEDHLQPPHQSKALPHGLTVEQQTSIKTLVKARVEQLPLELQARAAIICWSALKSKFGVTYKEIDTEHFADAVSLVARLPLEGELLPREVARQLDIHFPLDAWMALNAPLMGSQAMGGACIPASALIGGDARSAIGALLTLLEQRQYEVSACRAELRSLKSHLESSHNALNSIVDNAERTMRRLWREW